MTDDRQPEVAVGTLPTNSGSTRPTMNWWAPGSGCPMRPPTPRTPPVFPLHPVRPGASRDFRLEVPTELCRAPGDTALTCLRDLDVLDEPLQARIGIAPDVALRLDLITTPLLEEVRDRVPAPTTPRTATALRAAPRWISPRAYAPETGLHYNLFRRYAPETGRYTSRTLRDSRRRQPGRLGDQPAHRLRLFGLSPYPNGDGPAIGEYPSKRRGARSQTLRHGGRRPVALRHRPRLRPRPHRPGRNHERSAGHQRAGQGPVDLAGQESLRDRGRAALSAPISVGPA